MRRRWPVPLVAGSLLMIGLAAPIANAAPVCSFAAGTLSIVDDGAGFDAIDVWQDSEGRVLVTVGPFSGLMVPAGLCPQADVSEVRAIDLTGGTGLTQATIWMSQVPAEDPPLPPVLSTGPAADWGTIDWAIDLSANLAPIVTGPLTLGPVGIIMVVNASSEDPLNVRMGSAGIDLNDDGDLDVVPRGVGFLGAATVDAVGSTMSADGGGVTGGPVTGLVLLRGGPGDDRLTGGSGGETPFGDIVLGGGGDDVVDLGSGGDVGSGGSGDDELSGGPGGDQLSGGRGDDRIDGGPGRDRCRGGPGGDTVDCERQEGAADLREALAQAMSIRQSAPSSKPAVQNEPSANTPLRGWPFRAHVRTMLGPAGSTRTIVSARSVTTYRSPRYAIKPSAP